VNGSKRLYVEELRDLYKAESRMVRALPKMAKVSTSENLRAGLEEYLNQRKEQMARLEKIFKAPNGLPPATATMRPISQCVPFCTETLFSRD
jgi:ferritin-like metal-binding protein YciE